MTYEAFVYPDKIVYFMPEYRGPKVAWDTHRDLFYQRKAKGTYWDTAPKVSVYSEGVVEFNEGNAWRNSLEKRVSAIFSGSPKLLAFMLDENMTFYQAAAQCNLSKARAEKVKKCLEDLLR